MSFSFSSRKIGDVVVVTCEGRIVAGEEARSLHSHVTALLCEGPDIVLHLGAVTFVDSSGLGTLVRLLANSRRSSGDIKLCSLPSAVGKTLRLTNLHDVFESYDSEEQAISAFYRGDRAVKNESGDSGLKLLCVDDSVDVLAYVREVLRKAGYKAYTTTNIPDGLILMRAVKPGLVILGPKATSRHGQASKPLFTNVDSTVPVLELAGEFSTQDAGPAAAALVETIRATLHAARAGA